MAGKLITTRRTILKSTAGFGAFAALGPWNGALAASAPAGMLSADKAVGQGIPGGNYLPATPPTPKSGKTIGMAIMGLGGYALRQIMPQIAATKRVNLTAVVSGNTDKAARVAAAYGLAEDAVYSYETFDKIASDDRVDVVYIVLPSGLHAAWAKKAFDAGKHVLCEKPMALNGPECDYMIACAEEASRKLMIGYRCHFEPYNVKAAEIAKTKELGAPQKITGTQEYTRGNTDPARDWRVNRALAGGGPLEDYGIYGVNGAFYLSGEDAPASISATTENVDRFSEIFATVKSQLTFASGAVADLSTSYNGFGGNSLTMTGTKGGLTMTPATGYSGNALRVTPTGGEATVFDFGPSEVQFAGQLDHMADALLDNTTIITPGEMGRRDVRIIDAIYKSAELGKTVALNPDGTMKL